VIRAKIQTTPPEMSDLVSRKEAAAILGCTLVTVARALGEGALTTYKMPNGYHVRIDKRELEGCTLGKDPRPGRISYEHVGRLESGSTRIRAVNGPGVQIDSEK
jgi:excisionase family DNA binding protein